MLALSFPIPILCRHNRRMPTYIIYFVGPKGQHEGSVYNITFTAKVEFPEIRLKGKLLEICCMVHGGIGYRAQFPLKSGNSALYSYPIQPCTKNSCNLLSRHINFKEIPLFCSDNYCIHNCMFCTHTHTHTHFLL